MRENELKAEWVETIDHFFEMYGKLEDKFENTVRNDILSLLRESLLVINSNVWDIEEYFEVWLKKSVENSVFSICCSAFDELSAFYDEHLMNITH